MEEQDIIDLATFEQLKDLMGEEFLMELIDTYLVETGTLIEQLGKAFASGDAASMGRFAHSIKSSSASLGALVFSQQARELEMMGKANDLAGADPKVEQLAADFIIIKRRLEELRDDS